MKLEWAVRSIIGLVVAVPSLYLIYYMYYKPVFLQREVLGYSLTNLNSLPSFDFQPYQHIWTYSLTPVEQAHARKYCLDPDRFSGEKRELIQRHLRQGDCDIAIRNGRDGNLIAIDLIGGDLTVRSYNHPGQEFLPERAR